ncbi:DUF6246 family protein [Erwinia tracheiphila]|uniref:Uncharacterized protein n=1 Tax=Erwinia tracheiphila TaxID=65700 RepID=A0A345CRI4_9GAMM|nr:DUF6246 family protein [Erwinia tracheiphila]AXF76051.1 hypothetical protein AV903_08330 [Erwinia tracheiphila]UIA85287.1 DUF6246 family protein [Erwinia tracheiphila]
MTPYTEIGECLITLGGRDYFFRPSFHAMSRIGEPQEIVQAFYHLHNDKITPMVAGAVAAYGYVPKWMGDYIATPHFSKQAFYAAMSVLSACCEEDVTPLIGELRPGKTGKWTFVYRAGKMPLSDMVLIAQSLITHGIIGKAKIRKLQRHEGGNATTEFNAFEYISAARTHLGMSRDEAENLTMTEFQLLLAAKYPEQKGFTRDEYDAVADEYLAKRARRLGKK